MPAWSPKMQEEIDQGKLVLGGCCVSDHDPEWQCVEFETRIFHIILTINIMGELSYLHFSGDEF